MRLGLALVLLQRQVLDVVEELERVDVVLALHVLAVDRVGQVLGHDIVLVNRLNARLLKRARKLHELLVLVQAATEDQAARPGVDGGHRVGACLVALLVFAVVARHRAVRRLALDQVTLGRDELRGHHAQRAEALRDNVRLHVAVVVLARPHEAALALDRLRDHVVDQAVLVPDVEPLKLFLVRGVVQLLEDVLKLAVVRLENRVLRREVQRHLLVDRDVEARVRKAGNRVDRVVHGHGHAAVLVVLVHLLLDLLSAVLGRKGDGQLAGARRDKVLAAVLVTKRVTANADRLLPAGHRTRDLLQDDRLTEDGAAENVADRAVRREPHLLQVELLHTRLIGRDRGALDADLVFLDRLGRVDGDLVVGLIAVLDAQVVVLQVNVQEGKDELRTLVFFPRTSLRIFSQMIRCVRLARTYRHLVTIQLDHRARHLDLLD